MSLSSHNLQEILSSQFSVTFFTCEHEKSHTTKSPQDRNPNSFLLQDSFFKYSHSRSMAPAASPISLCIFAVALLINAAVAATYTNYTVGGDAGWFFNSTTNKAAANYSDWAAKYTFNLGDYLIFNTNSNQTVIQTYNETTYQNCTMDYSSDGDTFQYDGGVDQFEAASTVEVPLTILGTQYYFSDASDGEQCLKGMAFEIKVNRGLGLPPSLNQPPPPPPYSPPPSPADAGQPPPLTGVTGTPGNGGTKSGSDHALGLGLLSLVIFIISFWA